MKIIKNLGGVNYKNNLNEIIYKYDSWAEKYDFDLLSISYKLPKIMADLFFCFSQNKTQKILDAGCGTGFLSIELSKLGFYNLIGVDISKKMLEKACLKKNYINLINANLLNLPFKNNFFDSIFSVATIGIVSSKAFSELIRILKVDGFFCFSILEGNYFKKNSKFKKEIKNLEKQKIIKKIKIIGPIKVYNLTIYRFKKIDPYYVFLFKKLK